MGRTIKNDKFGLDPSNGCHNLHGARTLAFVRQRHQEAQGDLGRSRNRRKFLSALTHQAAEPGTVFNPLRTQSLLNAALGTLVVDKQTDLRSLVCPFEAMRGLSVRPV